MKQSCKFRLTQSFIDAIELAHEVFGNQDNDMTTIIKRAMRYHKSSAFEYSIAEGKAVTNPINFNIDIQHLSPREIQGLVIAYIDIQVIKEALNKKYEPVIDSCKNFIIED